MGTTPSHFPTKSKKTGVIISKSTLDVPSSSLITESICDSDDDYDSLRVSSLLSKSATPTTRFKRRTKIQSIDNMGFDTQKHSKRAYSQSPSPNHFNKEKFEKVGKNEKVDFFKKSKRSTSARDSLRNSLRNSPKSTPSPQIPETFIQNALDLIHSEKMSVVFDTEIDGWDARELNAHICGLKNVLFLIFIPNEHPLGFYSKDIIPLSTQFECTHVTSSNTFIFSVDETGDIKTYFSNSNSQRSFTLHSNEEKNFLFTCYAAFWITSNAKIYPHNAAFKTFPKLPEVFSSLKRSGTDCSKFVVVQLSDAL
ncbi:hypothetical protein EIN_274790 [Entamoeba invadens IP1]|uniref:TLDc domain-containing protein n=1 Tax=Entamoeba invadens IP1 TaxID=370355 RepID=A0A0A1U1K2_ENTIV|nr:hypothetical protein EIN_274790 [Entamoeba invadens IP1]ELP87892.1 hypothetical protein EIN_274790 [Entamoeba invadens IP1]|eukprot:XP_004254663.1 hypothetical protein EIN_274790 [Entamoeba invadens IP1]